MVYYKKHLVKVMRVEEANNAPVFDETLEITIKIDNEAYKFSAKIEELLFTEDANEDFDYKDFVSKRIYEKIENKKGLTFEKLSQQDELFFKEILSKYFVNNSKFEKIYSSTMADNEFERYTKAYIEFRGTASFSAIKMLSDSVTHLVSVMNESVISSATTLAETIGRMCESSLKWYISNCETISQTLASTTQLLSQFSQNIISSLIESVQYLNIPEISDEEREQLLQSYEKWGKYGWTIPPSANINCFDICPNTQFEADKIALQNCKQADMDRVFENLLTICVRKKDLKEAIDCYENGNYKACALLLFAIIDSRIIRLQNRNEKMAVGIGAVAKFKKKVKKENADKEVFFLALQCANIFACLFSVFDDTDNFKKKTKVINRNYLDHGMSSKTVRKKDCIKLFLLLYNLLQFIEFIK